MAKNLPKLMTDAKPQIQYAQGIYQRTNQKKRHQSISYSKCKKHEILREARGDKNTLFLGTRIRCAVEFLSETMQARKV